MKALVIAPEPFFSPRGTPLSVYYRTRALAELGVEVDLLTYGQGQDVEVSGVRYLTQDTVVAHADRPIETSAIAAIPRL